MSFEKFFDEEGQGTGSGSEGGEGTDTGAGSEGGDSSGEGGDSGTSE